MSVFVYLTTLGTAIIQTQAQYPDGSRMGITYSLFSGNKMQFFGINPTSGKQKYLTIKTQSNPYLRLNDLALYSPNFSLMTCLCTL
jgi:hypothetical protein